jgi:hypothetical protein
MTITTLQIPPSQLPRQCYESTTANGRYRCEPYGGGMTLTVEDTSGRYVVIGQREGWQLLVEPYAAEACEFLAACEALKSGGAV